MSVSSDQIKYVPPEIEGHVPEEILAKALAEANIEDVWNVMVAQTMFTPGADHQGYTVTATYGDGGKSREYKLTG